MALPKRDEQAAILLRRDESGNGYALYKVAPGGWPAGFLVLTKAGKHKMRRLTFVENEQEARIHVERFVFVKGE